MKSDMERTISEIMLEAERELRWEDGLLRTVQPGHTREAALHNECHDGRASAEYYAFGTIAGTVSQKWGKTILLALQGLQVRDSQHPQYGGMRWYNEETVINDTNAAFFILMPLTMVRLLYPHRIHESHMPVLNEMMDAGVEWFARECRHPILYYTNKIVSDGALLLAISRLRGHEEHFRTAVCFFERWDDYTNLRGWGWGENISLVYVPIILNALCLACLALENHKPDLVERLKRHIHTLLAFIRFQGPGEPVPVIRSYNFTGTVEQKTGLWSLCGFEQDVRRQLVHDSITGAVSLVGLMTLLLGAPFTQDALTEESEVPRERTERIFEDRFSYTWIGHNGRLGSINIFPVIPGCYQWSTWGLGWQSFPVSFRVEGEQVGYLRWSVREGGHHRTHPAESKRAYLSPALFGEDYYPDVETRCAQNGPQLIVYRLIAGVHNRMTECCDEWVIHRFRGDHWQFFSAGREWTVLSYGSASVAVAALQGIAVGRLERVTQAIEIDQEGDTLFLRQTLYRGEERVIRHPRIEAGWAVLFLDGVTDREEIRQRLLKTTIRDNSYVDDELPRNGARYLEIRHMEMEVCGTTVKLTIDPLAT